jgi:predicted TIM-barrel fold metal-dependent hydrolase
MWIGFAPDDPTLPAAVEFLGDDRILWASDFPHLDGIYPGAVKALEENTSGLSESSRERIAGANALAAYGLG